MRICLHDPGQIRAFLQQDPALHLYSMGDLDAFFWPHTSWYGWEVAGELKALALVYSGDALPVLLALGQQPEGALTQLLKALTPLLPARCYAHISAGAEAALSDDWSMSGGEPHVRMLLNPHTDWKAPDLPAGICIEALTPPHSEELQTFYAAHYPGNWFNARMLESGAYLGLRQDGALLAVAGIHVYAPAESVAALGNIAVAQKARGKGWGQVITAALCARLRAQGIRQIGLNVHADNRPAQACYRQVGFTEKARYGEWMLTRRL
ncbi:MAG: GNAT family N-acetyltransferase [Candidatus Sericytochromatia bacterium]